MDNKKEKTVCFTGHRELPILQVSSIRQRLRKTLEDLIEQGYCFFGTGGALGFDTIAAQTVLNLRDAWKYCIENIDGTVDLKYICKINELVSRNESLQWGR